jgi:hypothetical protein
MPPDRVLADFAGQWRLDKRIVPAEGPEARFEGVAEFVEVAEGLAYAERGRLWVGTGAPMEAERRYVWRPGLDVYFDDGRFFHRVPARGGRAHHHCPPDDYVVEYVFDNWPEFTALWRVTGSRKDYEMTARYRR